MTRRSAAAVLTGACILLCSAFWRQDEFTPAPGPMPVDEWLVTIRSWDYHPWLNSRESVVSLLYLSRSGAAVRMLGRIYEGTDTAQPIPVFNTVNISMLELGRWQSIGGEVTLTLDCLESMYVTARRGETACKATTTILGRNGRHLLSTDYGGYEPIIGVYPKSWKRLRDYAIKNACGDPRVRQAIPACSAYRRPR